MASVISEANECEKSSGKVVRENRANPLEEIKQKLKLDLKEIGPQITQQSTQLKDERNNDTGVNSEAYDTCLKDLENVQDQNTAATTDSFQLKSSIVQNKQQMEQDHRAMFMGSFASMKPVTVQEGTATNSIVDSYGSRDQFQTAMKDTASELSMQSIE